MINFLELVLKGYWYEQNYFPEYLIRELKKAEKENYEAKEFLGKCIDVVEGLKKELDKKKFAEKNFIFNALNNYKEPEKHQDEIAKGYQDMKNLSRKDFSVDLFNYTNGEILGTLYYDDVLELEFLILNAVDNYNLETDLEPLLNKYIKTRDFYLLQPFKAPSINKDNFEKWQLLLQISLKRYNYFVNNLPPEDKIQLKKDFSTYLDWIGEGKSNEFKILFNKYLDRVEEEFEEIKGKYHKNQNPFLKETEELIQHPKYNPNLWNGKAYELFKYLFENYYKGRKKRELTNIWFFLNEYEPENYVLKATKDEYKSFIKTGYNINLKNFDKAIDKYQFKEFPTMNDHRKDFEDLNK